METMVSAPLALNVSFTEFQIHKNSIVSIESIDLLPQPVKLLLQSKLRLNNKPQYLLEQKANNG